MRDFWDTPPEKVIKMLYPIRGRSRSWGGVLMAPLALTSPSTTQPNDVMVRILPQKVHLGIWDTENTPSRFHHRVHFM